MADVDLLLPLAMLVPASAIAALILPPVFLAVGRRRLPLASGLYLATVALLVAWVVTGIADMDRADRTGGEGSIFAGAVWLVLALAAATGSIVASLRRSPAVSGAAV